MGFKYRLYERVTVTGIPGMWRVWSPAPKTPHGAGQYWLQPSDDLSHHLASTLPHGMLLAQVADMHTQGVSQ